ncbi:MAG TPA: thioredoxin family protein [Clostridia bacterium]|nr:thioredoxin family protein [Clostridia bacterium]
MADLSENLNQLFDSGVGFEEYLGSADEVTRQKHMHYLEKMQLTEDEKKELAESIREDRELVVFCDTYCNDCRVTLALLENLRRSAPSVGYRIVSREGNEGLMERLSGDNGIPLIVEIGEGSTRNSNSGDLKGAKLIFNEFPDVLLDDMLEADPDNKEKLITDYRKGLYKDIMLKQIVEKLS